MNDGVIRERAHGKTNVLHVPSSIDGFPESLCRTYTQQFAKANLIYTHLAYGFAYYLSEPRIIQPITRRTRQRAASGIRITPEARFASCCAYRGLPRKSRASM